MDNLFEDFEREFPNEYKKGIATGLGEYSALSTVEASEVLSQYGDSRIPRLSEAVIVKISSDMFKDVPVQTETKHESIKEKLTLII